MQTAQDKPRFRDDLVASPLETEGVKYVDVSDPASGSKFRFFEVEYAIAKAMNGERDLVALAAWAQKEVGVDTSADELAMIQATLADLGYLVGGAAARPARSETVDADSIVIGERAATPLPTPAPAKPAADDMSFADVMVDEQPAAASPPALAADDDLLPPPSLPDVTEADDDRTKIPSGEEVSVDLSAHLSLDKKQVADAVRASRVMQAVAPPIDVADDEDEAPAGKRGADKGFDEPTRLAPEVQAIAAKEAAKEAARLPSMGETDEPTTLKPAAPAAAKAEPVKPVEQPKVEAFKPMAEPGRAAAAATAAKAEPAKPAAAAKDDGKKVTPLPGRPEPKPATPAEAEPAAKKKGSPLTLVLVLVLLAAGAAAVWWFFLRAPDEGYKAPPAPTAKAPAKPAKPALPPLAAKVTADAPPATEYKAGVAGKLAALAPAGVAAPGTVLYKLAGTAPWEQKKAQALPRRDFYKVELDKAKAANAADKIAVNEAKLKEKQDIIDQADAELAKLQAIASEEVTFTPAADLKVGAALAVDAPIGSAVSTKAPALKLAFDKLDGYTFDKDGKTMIRVVGAEGAAPLELEVTPADGGGFVAKLPEGAGLAADQSVSVLPAPAAK